MSDEYDFKEVLRRLENLSDDDIHTSSSMGIPISPIQSSKYDSNKSYSSENSEKTLYLELCSRYNIMVSSREDLFNEIERLIRIEKTAEFKESQLQTEKSELQEKFRKYKSLYQQQTHDLQDKIDQIQTLNRTIELNKDNEIKKDQEIQNLKEKQKSLRNELNEAQNQVKRLKTNIEDDVTKAFTNIYDRFQLKSDEIIQLTEQRNSLIALIYKQKAYIDNITRIASKNTDKIQNTQLPNNDEKLLETLCDNINSYASNDIISKVESIKINKELKTQQKICSIIEFLLSKSETDELSKRTKFLEHQCSNLISILDQESALFLKIASDENLSQIIFPSEKQILPTEFREKLIREASLVSSYVEKTIPVTFKALAEVQKLNFFAFGEEKDVSKIVDIIYEQHKKGKDDAKSLFFLFTAQLAASTILRRFASDKDARVSFLTRENSNLKRNLDEYNIAIKENKEYREREQKMLEILKTAFEIHNETNILLILEAAVSSFKRSYAEGERAKRLRISLEKMKQEFSQKMFEVTEKYKEEIEKMDVERVKIEMEFGTKNKNLELENNKLTEKNQKLNETVEELKKSLETIIERSEKVQNLCETQKKKLSEETKKYEKQLSDIAIQLKESIDKQRELVATNKFLKEENAKLKTRTKELEKSNEKSHEVLREAARAARDEKEVIRLELNKEIAKIKEEANELKEKIDKTMNEKNALFIENKTLSLELQSISQQRDAAVSRAKTADELLQGKIENTELKEKVVNFINNFAQHSETELNVVSDDDIVRSLDAIEEEITNDEDRFILNSCMKSLDIDDKSKVAPRISDLVKENTFIGQQIQILKSEILSIKDKKERDNNQWERWGRKLLVKTDNPNMLTSEQVRQFLEEEILSSRTSYKSNSSTPTRNPLIPIYI